MTEIIIDAGTLTANADDRTVTGLLVPYGEECRSNLGRFSVDSGAFSIPDASVVGFNVEHVREDVIGRAMNLRDTPEGIVATFSVAPGEDGDAALADVRNGKRRHLSAEVANVVIKAGRAVGGKLFGGALVERPAFPSATLLAAAADTDVKPIEPDDPDAATTEESKTNEDGSQTETVTSSKSIQNDDGTTVNYKTVTTVTTEAAPEVTDESTTDTEEKAVAVPNTLSASKAAPSKPISKAELFTLLASRDSGTLTAADEQRVAAVARATGMFALSDITYDKTGTDSGSLSVPQWLGEVYDGNPYGQKYLPLFAHGDLTALKFQQYAWDVKPQGGDWAGNKAQVPSNTPKFKIVEGTAGRYAVAHDIARELRDFRVFGDASFFDMYANAVTEDYKRWADEKVLSAVLGAATTVVADDPTGLDIGPAMSALVDGAAAVIANNATPTFGIVELSYWKQIAKTPQKDILGYLNAQLGLTGENGRLDTFSLIPSTDLAASNVLVGAGQAATVLELPGVPLRMDALNVAQGGYDEGAFGYLGVNVQKADALVKVTPHTAG